MPSTVIGAFAYDPASRTLTVTFRSGRRYRYHQVPAETYQAMRESFSKGAFFNRHVRDQFHFTEDPPIPGLEA